MCLILEQKVKVITEQISAWHYSKFCFVLTTIKTAGLPCYITIPKLQPFEKHKQALEQHRKVLKIAFISTVYEIMQEH